MAKFILDQTEIDRRFDYHAPSNAAKLLHEKVRRECKHLATILGAELPVCREASLAMTALEECLMWSNAAIAREQKPE